jgi:hypothetical protein
MLVSTLGRFELSSLPIFILEPWYWFRFGEHLTESLATTQNSKGVEESLKKRPKY